MQQKQPPNWQEQVYKDLQEQVCSAVFYNLCKSHLESWIKYHERMSNVGDI